MPDHDATQGDWTGRRIGPYEIGPLIGRGGMGEVYRGHDRKLNRPVAVKCMRSDWIGRHDRRRRFLREARIAATLVHPHVATVFDVIDHDETPLLVMELVPGRPLSDALKDGSLPAERLCDIGGQIGTALGEIHEHGLIHRDLKPGNVMITPDGFVKLMDFGLSTYSHDLLQAERDSDLSTLTATGERNVRGTLLYMSPEQLRGDALDHRSDLFSLGVILYEAATGEHPFRCPSLPETQAAILHRELDGPESSEGLNTLGPVRSLVLKLLHKDRERRPGSAMAVVEALEDGRRVVAPMPATPRRRRLLLWAAAVSLVALVATAGVLAWTLTRPVWSDPRLALAVCPFEDRTGTEDGPARAALLGELLDTDLLASRLVRSVGPSETGELLRNVSDGDRRAAVSQVHATLAVDYVLMGTLYREEDELVATAELIPVDPSAGQRWSVQARGATVLQVAESLAGGLRRELPMIPAVLAWLDDGVDLRRATSRSPEARRLRQEALEHLAVDRPRPAIEALEAAVALDDGYTDAWLDLAGALHDVGYGRRAREAMTAAARTVEALPRSARRLRRLQIDVREAVLFDRPRNRAEAARKLNALYPDDPATHVELAYALGGEGRHEDALAAIRRATEMEPRHGRWLLAEARIARAGADADAANTALTRATTVFEDAGSVTGQAEVALEQGRLAHADSRFEEAIRLYGLAAQLFARDGTPLQVADANGERAKLVGLLGDVDAAVATLEEVAETARAAGNPGMECDAIAASGALRMAEGRFDLADDLLRRAVDVARRLENASLLSDPLGNLATLSVYQGDLANGAILLDEAIEVARAVRDHDGEMKLRLSRNDVLYQRGEVLEAISGHRALVAEDGPWPRRMAALAQLSLGEIHLRQGLFGDALAATRTSGEGFDALGDALLGAYADVQEAVILAWLGDVAGAEPLLAASAEIAAAAPDLGARREVAEALVKMAAGDLDAARAQLAVLASDGTLAPAVAGAIHGARCAVEAAAGRWTESRDHCRTAIELEGVPVPDAIAARARICEASARSDEPAPVTELTGPEPAVVAGMSIHLATARLAACLAVAGQAGPRVLTEGRSALSQVLDGVPSSQRETFENRDDVRWMSVALASQTEGNSS